MSRNYYRHFGMILRKNKGKPNYFQGYVESALEAYFSRFNMTPKQVVTMTKLFVKACLPEKKQNSRD